MLDNPKNIFHFRCAVNILICSLQSLCSEDKGYYCTLVPEFLFLVNEEDCILMLPYAVENIPRSKETGG